MRNRAIAPPSHACADPAIRGFLIGDPGVPKSIGYFVLRCRVPPSGPGNGSRSPPRRKIMSRVALFSSPLLLGFEHFERALDRVNKVSGDGYPPYNVEQLSENELRITLAVAGFTMADLAIAIEDNQLVIRGRQADDAERVYLHRGIAARQFQRSFVLAEGIEVRGAWLENGLLHVDLVRPTVAARVRTVPIRGPEPADTGRPRPLRARVSDNSPPGDNSTA